MRAFARFVSRCLLFIMLATVFSPSFGWEAVDGMAAHEHATAHEMGMAHGDAHDCDDCPGHEAATGGDLDHHCCPGHVLGHFPGGLQAGLNFMLPQAGSVAVDGPARRFSSRIPEGLERPPRSAA